MFRLFFMFILFIIGDIIKKSIGLNMGRAINRAQKNSLRLKRLFIIFVLVCLWYTSYIFIHNNNPKTITQKLSIKQK